MIQQADQLPGKPPSKAFQTIGILVILGILVVAILWVRSRPKSDADEANNALNPNQIAVTKAASEAIQLETQPVKIEHGAGYIQTSGVIHFSPYSTMNVSPKLTGRIQSVMVKIGDRVTAGQPLAQMSSGDAATAVGTEHDAEEQLRLTDTALKTARQQYQMGTPEVTAAQATFIQAQENTAYTRRMLALTREQGSIGGFTDKPLTDAQSAERQAVTQLSQDEKDLALAQKQFDRQTKLFGYGVVARADVEAADDTLGKAKDAVANDNEQLRIARVTLAREQKAYGTHLYSNQSVRQAETNYQQAVIQERSASTALRMAKAALFHDLKQAQHDYETAKSDLHTAQTVLGTYDHPGADGSVIIRSPAAGVVTARNVNVGQVVDQTGQTPWQMFTIVNSDTVYLDSQIYEKDMPRVHIGQDVSATSDALPKSYQAKGVVSYVSPGLDPATHALSVRADMKNADGLLKDGMYLNAMLMLGADGAPSQMVVPLTAVVHDGDDDYVFVKSGDGKYARRKITLGVQRGESDVVVTKGLQGDETVVAHGALYLGAGGSTAQ